MVSATGSRDIRNYVLARFASRELPVSAVPPKLQMKTSAAEIGRAHRLARQWGVATTKNNFCRH